MMNETNKQKLIKTLFEQIWIEKPKNNEKWLLYCNTNKIPISKEVLNSIWWSYYIESKAIDYLNNNLKWNVKKANNILDKYQQIDLIGCDNNKNACVIQVKSKKYNNYKISNMVKYALNKRISAYLVINNNYYFEVKRIA